MKFCKEKFGLMIVGMLLFLPTIAMAGPYNEAGINGYINLKDWHHADPSTQADDPNVVLNPMFRGWAGAVSAYVPVPAPSVVSPWNFPANAIGTVTGNDWDVVSLGDLNQSQINSGIQPGRITLLFNQPNNIIRDVNGYDFVVFENGFASGSSTTGGSVSGQMFAELAYVEISSNGINFVRFPSVSLTPSLVGNYGTVDITNIHNLAGKHPNSSGVCTGTPFDLHDLANEPDVISGLIDLHNIQYVRIVDIPGNGNFFDDADKQVDPASWPTGAFYSTHHPIYDTWLTWGSGGFDLEAIGVLKDQLYNADINLDGVVDMTDFAIFANTWQRHFGEAGWLSACDLAQPRNSTVDCADLMVFAGQWLHEQRTTWLAK